MGSVPTVSTIVPLYNGAAYVRGAVLSALGQTYPHVEVVVVNDGSPDDSEDVLGDLLSDPRVTYVKQHNRGVAGARNAGIAASRGELIAFLDQDDIWLPDKLEQQVGYLAAHPEIALVHGNVRFIDAAGAPLREHEARWDADARQGVGHCFPVLFAKNRLAMLTVCLRRSAFDETGAFREDIPGVDDYEYWLRLSRRHAFAHINRPLALYRLHGSNESLVNWLPQHVKTLQAIDGVLAADPAAHKALRRDAYAERIHTLASLVGLDLARRNLHDEARPYLRRALRHRPMSWRLIRTYALGLAPARVRTALRWYAHRLRGARGDGNTAAR